MNTNNSMSNPLAIEKLKNSITEVWRNPLIRHKIVSSQKEGWTSEKRQKQSLRLREAWKSNSKLIAGIKKRFKANPMWGTVSEYRGKNFRSSWEVKVAKWLDTNNIKWEYEQKHFLLPNGRIYVPDFYLPESNSFLEVKGFMREGDKEKFDFVSKNHILYLIDRSNIKNIELNKKWRNTEND